MAGFSLGAQTQGGSERKRLASDHDLTKANYLSVVQRNRILSGQSAQSDAAALAAAQALFQGELDKTGQGT